MQVDIFLSTSTKNSVILTKEKETFKITPLTNEKYEDDEDECCKKRFC
jgi:hypothetical protein